MNQFSSLMFIIYTFLLLLVITAQTHLSLLYIAYFFRGSAQSGLHMLWHLSGPYYAKNKESSLYSSVTLTLVSFRGLFAPALGYGLAITIGPLFSLFLISSLCGLSSILFYKDIKEEKIEIQKA